MIGDPFNEVLTARERQVAGYIVDGFSAKEIGNMLSISPRTVEAHRWNICRKLQARNTADIVRIALEARMGLRGKEPEAPLKAGDGLLFIRPDDLNWEETAPGVEMKMLHFDAARSYSTKLVRMLPGARYPGHLHSAAEELFMLEGDFQIGDRILAPGDYHRAEFRSVHPQTSTKFGCKFLLLSSHLDELID